MYKIIWVFLVLIAIFRIGEITFFRSNYNDDERVELNGRIVSEPISNDFSQSVELDGYRVFLPKSPVIEYGDSVTIEGTYNSNDNTIRKASVQAHVPGNSIFISTRKSVLDLYERMLPPDEAGLVSGITLGSKSLIESDFWESIKKSGTAHVVVASGTNIVLVSSFLISTLTFFVKRPIALVFTFIGIWTYTAFVGFEAPIIRASIMATSAYVFQWFGRVYRPFNVLLAVATVMLVFVPIWFRDVGFYLSFFATAGLLFLEKPIESKLYYVPAIIRGDLATTLAAQIAVSPILIFFFGSFNWLSPIVNTFVLWTIVPITVIGFVSALAGIFVPSVGEGILLLAYPFAWWFVTIVNWFG